MSQTDLSIPSTNLRRNVFSDDAALVAPAQSRFAFIQSSWHEAIVDQGRLGFMSEMASHGVQAQSIDLYQVPGAFEIPLHVKKLAQSGRYAAVVCCGLVVDGGIYRHDFVANAVINGLMAIQLDTGVPVFTAILTPHNFHEHEEHRRYFMTHFLTKGKEVAQACLQTLGSLQKMRVLLST